MAGDRVVGDDAAPKSWAESHVMVKRWAVRGGEGKKVITCS